MADFDIEVSRWVDGKAKPAANAILRVGAIDMVNRVKELTPVDTGFLRSNWTAIIKGGEEPIAGRVQPPEAVIMSARIGDVIVILNPTIYARRIEYGFVGEDSLGRHFHQQGVHMVAQTMAEAPAIFDAAVARVGGG